MNWIKNNWHIIIGVVLGALVVGGIILPLVLLFAKILWAGVFL